MGASKRMMLAKAIKDVRASKAGASSAPAADPNPPSTLPLPPPTTTEAPLGSSSPSPHSPEALQTPGSPLPIAAVPLALASSPAPTPLDKGKRVLEIIFDDEDSDGVAPFKRRKSARVPLLPAASPQEEDSFRDNPPSATSLPPTTVQEDIGEGAEYAPPPPPAEVSASPAPVAAAPDFIAIPPPIMHLMRGFSGGTMPEGSDRKEGMPFYLRAFLAVALEWRAQARNAVLQTQTLQALETRVASLEEEKKILGRQNEAYQTTLKEAQKSKAEAEEQLAEAMELQADFYTREIALKVRVTSLQDIVAAYEEVQKDLKARCCEQADEMERMEGEVASQAKAMGLLQVDYDKLQVEVSRLRVEKEALEKQVVSGDATIEELEKDKKTLI
ncbi:formin-like protein 18 [Phaseolus vulgaris]|uniref:formin-like protein 18 n=1 Tax=Phaseolus vulgaris TaxID=3885 RepID=UPI0035C9E90D